MNGSDVSESNQSDQSVPDAGSESERQIEVPLLDPLMTQPALGDDNPLERTDRKPHEQERREIQRKIQEHQDQKTQKVTKK